MNSHRNTARLVRTALLRFCSLLAVTSLSVQIAAADTLLRPHTAEYKVKISVIGGQLNTELKSTSEGYVATHVIKATGMSRILSGGKISNTAEFHTAADGVRPFHFTSKDTLTRDKVDAEINFDWDTGEARGTVNGEHVSSVMEELAHDRISIQYELMLDLINGAPDDQYILYDVDELKTVNVRNLGSRQVKVPAGKFTAIGIEQRAVGSKRITTMWCVKELDYLPVIIEQHRKGKLRMRAVLKKYEPIRS